LVLGSFEINPDIPERQALENWWKSGGRTLSHSSVASEATHSAFLVGAGPPPALEELKHIADLTSEISVNHAECISLGVVTIISLLKNRRESGDWYPACGTNTCRNRKVNLTTDNRWFCDRCQNVVDVCSRRWIFTAAIADETGSTWVTFFNDQAEALLGETADEVYERTHKDGFDESMYNSVFDKVMLSEWILKVRRKKEYYENLPRVQTHVVNLWPVDYVQGSEFMLRQLGRCVQQ
jgi:replication factor A1